MVAPTLLLLSIATLHGQRFDYDPKPRYRIQYPQGFVVQTAAGRDSIHSADGKLTGTLETKSLPGAGEPKALLAARIAAVGIEAAYKAVHEDWFVFSGIDKGFIVYEKVLVRAKVLQILSLRYPLADKTRFNDPVTKLSASFQAVVRLTAKVSVVQAEGLKAAWLTVDDEVENIRHTCYFPEAEAERFAPLVENQVIVVEGKLRTVNLRQRTEALGGIYEERLEECVLIRAVPAGTRGKD